MTTKTSVKDVLNEFEAHKDRLSKTNSAIVSIRDDFGLEQIQAFEVIARELIQGIDAITLTITNLQRPVSHPDAAKVLEGLKGIRPGVETVANSLITRQSTSTLIAAPIASINDLIAQLLIVAHDSTIKLCDACIDIAPTPEIEAEKRRVGQEFDNIVRSVRNVYPTPRQ
ncbi:hypothetical protein AN958_05712 [Leucoagaricus sp. SymC.cos]|nr:hypothetical protein AN958_05712 [Leucoagaricus sp. SymC.cos]